MMSEIEFLKEIIQKDKEEIEKLRSVIIQLQNEKLKKVL